MLTKLVFPSYLSSFFVEFNAIISPEASTHFISNILRTVFSGKPWNDISLYFLLNSLSCITVRLPLKFSDVENIIIKTEKFWSAQEKSIRSANQQLLLSILFSGLHSNSENSVEEKVSTVSLIEILKSLNVSMWENSREIWHQYIFPSIHSGDSSISVTVSETFPSSDVAALWVSMILEKNAGDHQLLINTEKFLIERIDFLDDCHSRPYLSPRKVSWALEFIRSLLEILEEMQSDLSMTDFNNIYSHSSCVKKPCNPIYLIAYLS